MKKIIWAAPKKLNKKTRSSIYLDLAEKFLSLGNKGDGDMCIICPMVKGKYRRITKAIHMTQLEMEKVFPEFFYFAPKGYKSWKYRLKASKVWWDIGDYESRIFALLFCREILK